MSDSSGKNPITTVFSSIGGAITMFFMVIAGAAIMFGLATARKPVKGDWGNVAHVGSFIGAVGNMVTRSTVDTFAPEVYDKTNTIDGSDSQPRSTQPQRLTPDYVPTSTKVKSNQTNKAAVITDQSEAYDVDLNGNPIAPLTPIKKR